MNIEQFIHIVEVARTKSFFTAAKNLHVTQSAISRSIGNLENELGIKLFTRSRQGTVVSDEGESIIIKANEILLKVQEIKEEVLIHKAVLHDEIRIAASPGLFSSVLPKTIASFNKDFPYVKIQVMERSNKDIQEELLKNKIDFGILPIIYPKIWIENEFTIEPLKQTNLKVIVSKDSLLANKKLITPFDLNNHPFVLYSDNPDIYKALLNDLNKYFTPLHILFTSNNFDIIFKYVSEGLAISLMSETVLKDNHYVKSGQIIPLELESPIIRPMWVGAVHSKKHYSTKTAKEFLKYLKNEFENEEES
ncbi:MULTISPECIES: LysR family transcriptional regulator [Bacillaceae]|uniref:LysR family transcriptional regulator n=1 Tax=Bacillaceae TaxID=186817 RepID=UPI000BFBA88D|nr:LysR family transcriptional regulator [Bacillus sp. AFS031507]PGY13012.1 hypothetical protein COE25_07490 [Bacillus sp. AFS031507]